MIETIVVGTLFAANLWWLVLPFRSLVKDCMEAVLLGIVIGPVIVLICVYLELSRK